MRCPFVVVVMFQLACGIACGATADKNFDELAERYIDEFAKFSPVGATALGDHRYDDQLDNVDAHSRQGKLKWLRSVLSEVDSIDRNDLSRANQVDLSLLRHQLQFQVWQQISLQEWAWNPLIYTGIAGDSIYSLMARDFAPARQRVNNAVHRLEQLPRFLQQTRATLDRSRVPQVHAKTAAAQNRGVLKIIENMVSPLASELSDSEQARLMNAIGLATKAINEHQVWLDEELVPAAKASYRLPAALYDQKLAYTLHSTRIRQEIRNAAELRLKDLHKMMFEIATPINKSAGRKVANTPSAKHLRDVIRFALEKAYEDRPEADQLVATAERSAKMCTDFIREKDLISLMPDPLEIILMPEFRRGVSVAYCDSPGPLDVGQKLSMWSRRFRKAGRRNRPTLFYANTTRVHSTY